MIPRTALTLLAAARLTCAAQLHEWTFAEPAGTLPAGTANTFAADTFSNPAEGGFATDGNGSLRINGVDYGTTVTQSLASLGGEITGEVWFRWDIQWAFSNASATPREVFLIHRETNGSNRFRWTLSDNVGGDSGGLRINLDSSAFPALSNLTVLQHGISLAASGSISLVERFVWTDNQITGIEAYFSVDGVNFPAVNTGPVTPVAVGNLGELRIHAKGDFSRSGDQVRFQRIRAGRNAADIGFPAPPPPEPGPEPIPDPAPGGQTRIELHQSGFIPGLRADTALAADGTTPGTDSPTLRVGANSNPPAGGRNALLVFPLPVLPPGSDLTRARLSVSAERLGTPEFSADLWGIGFHHAPEPPETSYLAGTVDPDATLLAPGFLSPTLPQRFIRVTTPAAADEPLAAFLSEFYAQNPAYTGGAFVTLRVNPDTDPGVLDRGYTLRSSDHPALIERPVLYLVLNHAEPDSPGQPSPRPRPNILLFITDDQRWDAVGRIQQTLEDEGRARFPWLQGFTPGMDRLADEGIRFDNAFVTVSICSPSRAAMLTGRYPHHTGIMNNQTYFPEDSVTFATLLRDSGYATGYFGKWHHHDQAARPGFDTIATFLNQGNYAGPLSNRSNDFHVNGTIINRSEWVEDVSTGYLLDFIHEQADSGSPFLAVIGFKSPHGGEPFADPAEGNTTAGGRIPRTSADNALFSDTAAFPIAPPASVNDRPPFRPAAASGLGQVDNRNYLETLVGVDFNVRRVLDLLDERGIARDTVVLYTSDNGYFLGEHSLGDKRAAYEESMRIPFFLRYPALQRDSGERAPLILNVDIAPTLLELAGIPVPPTMEGRSLLPLLRGEDPADWREDFFFTYTRDPRYPSAVPSLNAVRRQDGAKYVQYPFNKDWDELFLTAVDPHERVNRIQDPEHTELLAFLQTRLGALMRETGAMDLRILSGPGGQPLLRLHTGGTYKFRLEQSDNLQTWFPVQLGEETATAQTFLGTGQPWSLPLPDASAGRAFFRIIQVDDGNASHNSWNGSGPPPAAGRHPSVP